MLLLRLVLWVVLPVALGASVTANADTFSVLTFNAEVFNSGGDTAAVVAASDADIVGLQERQFCLFGCTGFDAGDAAALGYEFHAFGSTPANLGADDNAVLSRFPIVETFSDGVRIELPSGRDAYVWVVHLTPFPYEPYEIRDGNIVNEAEAIASAIATRGSAVGSVLSQMTSALASGDPVILMGDFNEPSHLDWTPAAAGLGMHFGLAVDWPSSNAVFAAGLDDAYRVVRPDETVDVGDTWTPEPVGNEVHDRIDFVHVAGDDLEVLEALIVGEDASQADVVVSPWVSDHRGVLVTLTTDFACSDGFDNDGDGNIDFPADAECLSASDLSEVPDCRDGLDNDGDGGIDWDGAGIGPPDTACNLPDRRTEKRPKRCGVGASVALVLPLWVAARGRRRLGSKCFGNAGQAS